MSSVNQRRRRKSTVIKSSGAEIKTVSGGVVTVLKSTLSVPLLNLFFLCFFLRANIKSGQF